MRVVRKLRAMISHYRYRTLVSLVATLLLFYVANQTGIVCNNNKVEETIQQLCKEYASERVMGSLCEPLCRESGIGSVSCTPTHSGKHLVFSIKWGEDNVYVKSAGRWNYKAESNREMSEEVFREKIRDLVTKKLNISATSLQLDRLTHITARPLPLSGESRHKEHQQVLALLQSQEYLMSVLFADRDVFPQIFGTCGHLFAVEQVSRAHIDSFYVFDGQQVWSERMKLAILIMDFLEQIETDFPDPLRLCNVKMDNFGLSSSGRLKYLELDQVYTDNVVQRITGSGQVCSSHEDCDLTDCKASCNALTKRCDQGSTNNNLQVKEGLSQRYPITHPLESLLWHFFRGVRAWAEVVCENIFVGWTLSGKLLVPGLLMTENTPASLSTLLRQCADNRRGAVPEDIRQRLYTTLTEMDQIIAERLGV